jgi:hypothetical protein
MVRRVGQVRSWVLTGPLTGFVCLLALLGVLAATTGLDASGWLAGVGEPPRVQPSKKVAANWEDD